MSNNHDHQDDETMCFCSGTKRGQIRELYLQGKDMDAISRWTGALTGCGGCEWDMRDFLEELAAQADKKPSK